MEKSLALREAIDGLYKTFSLYPIPLYTDPCLNCHSVAEDIALRSKPLRQAEISDLRDYAVDAIYDWGDVDCFKHFMPRIFELFVSAPETFTSFTDPEVLFAKFRYGNWRKWPAEEQKAVELFLRALWDQVLNDPPPVDSYTDVESWICSIAQCEDDLSPYLRAWTQDRGLTALLALSSFLISSNIIDEGGKVRNAFWEAREEQYAQLKLWVRSEAVIQRFDLAASNCSDEEISRELRIAEDLSRGSLL